jgi:hypothetical protein
VLPNAKFPTLALAIDRSFINLARMTANGPELVMRAPRSDGEYGKTDIPRRAFLSRSSLSRFHAATILVRVEFERSDLLWHLGEMERRHETARGLKAETHHHCDENRTSKVPF